MDISYLRELRSFLGSRFSHFSEIQFRGCIWNGWGFYVSFYVRFCSFINKFKDGMDRGKDVGIR